MIIQKVRDVLLVIMLVAGVMAVLCMAYFFLSLATAGRV